MMSHLWGQWRADVLTRQRVFPQTQRGIEHSCSTEQAVGLLEQPGKHFLQPGISFGEVSSLPLAPAFLPSPCAGYCDQQTLLWACFINPLLRSCKHGWVLLLAGEEPRSVLTPGDAPVELNAAFLVGPCPASPAWHPGCCIQLLELSPQSLLCPAGLLHKPAQDAAVPPARLLWQGCPTLGPTTEGLVHPCLPKMLWEKDPNSESPCR